MIDAGDIVLADLRDERRRLVLVVSADRFHRTADRAVVVPQVSEQHDDVPFPWRIEMPGGVFAVDLLRTLPVDRLLDRVDRAPAHAFDAVRRAIREIT